MNSTVNFVYYTKHTSRYKKLSDPCEKPEIENGEVSPTSETVKSGESYEVTCSSGHSLSEPTLSTLTCTNGELSTLPTCEPGIETSLHLEVEFFSYRLYYRYLKLTR